MKFGVRFSRLNFIYASLFALIVLAESAVAVPSCPLVKVEQTGAASTGCDAAVLVTNLENGVSGWPKDEARWFCFDSTNDRADAMLAVALTALSNQKTAQICPKNSNVFSNWSYLNQMWVTRW